MNNDNNAHTQHYYALGKHIIDNPKLHRWFKLTGERNVGHTI